MINILDVSEFKRDESIKFRLEQIINCVSSSEQLPKEIYKN